MDRRALVLDANILIRAVLGQRVRRILEAHADNVSFFIPEAHTRRRRSIWLPWWQSTAGDPAKALLFHRSIAALATVVGLDVYADFRNRSAEAAWRTRSCSAIPACALANASISPMTAFAMLAPIAGLFTFRWASSRQKERCR